MKDTGETIVEGKERGKEERSLGNPCWKDRAGICEGIPITFRIGDSLNILRIEQP